jgi:hypothetical protein
MSMPTSRRQSPSPAGSTRPTSAIDDAFEVRTTLRLNVALGALSPPTYNQPLK